MAININNVSLKMSAGRIEQFPREPLPQIAFAGRSNVGKSSLINTLLNRKSLARVSASPGKTVTVNFYDIDRTFFLVDLPGYGYAKRAYDDKERWSSLTDGYFSKNPNRDCIRLVVQLVDIRVGPTKDDLMMLEYLSQTAMPFIVVATKCDKLSKTGVANAVQELCEICSPYAPEGEEVTVIPFSSVSREGKDRLFNEITKAIK